MPRMTETEARRPLPMVRRRARQDSFRRHRGSSVHTEDMVLEIRGTYGGRASATHGVMFRELVGLRATQGGNKKTGWSI